MATKASERGNGVEVSTRGVAAVALRRRGPLRAPTQCPRSDVEAAGVVDVADSRQTAVDSRSAGAMAFGQRRPLEQRGRLRQLGGTVVGDRRR